MVKRMKNTDTVRNITYCDLNPVQALQNKHPGRVSKQYLKGQKRREGMMEKKKEWQEIKPKLAADKSLSGH